ncbi:MAG: hypothetical protein ACYCSN_19820 [Acidobacteriaceae bacterium]
MSLQLLAPTAVLQAAVGTGTLPTLTIASKGYNTVTLYNFSPFSIAIVTDPTSTTFPVAIIRPWASDNVDTSSVPQGKLYVTQWMALQNPPASGDPFYNSMYIAYDTSLLVLGPNPQGLGGPTPPLIGAIDATVTGTVDATITSGTVNVGTIDTLTAGNITVDNTASGPVVNQPVQGSSSTSNSVALTSASPSALMIPAGGVLRKLIIGAYNQSSVNTAGAVIYVYHGANLGITAYPINNLSAPGYGPPPVVLDFSDGIDNDGIYFDTFFYPTNMNVSAFAFAVMA